jgi:hypothetical protein
MKLKVHPACSLFPEMSDGDYANLRDDIKARGLIDPITVHAGYIVDGRHRNRACDELGIEARTVPWVDDGDLVGWVCAKNLSRRHLTPSQRANIAVELVPLYAQQAASREKAGTLAPTGARVKSAKMAAKAVGSTERSVERAQKVAKEAPEKRDAIAEGTLTLRAAEREIAAAKAPPEPEPDSPFKDLTHQRLMLAVRQLQADVKAAVASPIGKFIPMNVVLDHLEAAWSSIRSGKPYAKCPACREGGCKACRKLGWVPRHVFDGFPEEMRREVKEE